MQAACYGSDSGTQVTENYFYIQYLLLDHVSGNISLDRLHLFWPERDREVFEEAIGSGRCHCHWIHPCLLCDPSSSPSPLRNTLEPSTPFLAPPLSVYAAASNYVGLVALTSSARVRHIVVQHPLWWHFYLDPIGSVGGTQVPPENIQPKGLGLPISVLRTQTWFFGLSAQCLGMRTAWGWAQCGENPASCPLIQIK